MTLNPEYYLLITIIICVMIVLLFPGGRSSGGMDFDFDLDGHYEDSTSNERVFSSHLIETYGLHAEAHDLWLIARGHTADKKLFGSMEGSPVAFYIGWHQGKPVAFDVHLKELPRLNRRSLSLAKHRSVFS